MKKIILTGAALSAALIAGQAAAIPLNANGTPNMTTIRGSVTEIRIAGASAPTPLIERAFNRNCLPNTSFRLANGTSHFVLVCDRDAAILPSPNTQYLMMQKRDSGGSVTGVRAALNNPQAPWVTDAVIQAATGCNASGCTTMGAATRVGPSNANVADVDAAKFEEVINGGLTGAKNLPSAAIAAQIFGVPVNLIMYRALQQLSVNVGTLPANCAPLANGGTVETEACMPSLTQMQLTSIFGDNAARVGDTRNFRSGAAAISNLFSTVVPGQPALAANARNLHICQRTAGSGTQAVNYIKNNNAPCFAGHSALVSANAPTIGADGVLGQKVLHSNSASGDVDNCLEALNNGATVGGFTWAAGPRYAIGYHSLDRNANNAKAFRFIKINGFAGTQKNVVEGKYHHFAELTRVGNLAGSQLQLDLVNDILRNLQDPVQIAAISPAYSWGISGFLTLATSSAFPIDAATGGNYNPARPVSLYTHGPSSSVDGSGIDHCRFPAVPAGRPMQIVNP